MPLGPDRGVLTVVSSELGAQTIAYQDVIAFAGALDEAASWQPTGCSGWAVRDLIFHLLGDSRRALVALASEPAVG